MPHNWNRLPAARPSTNGNLDEPHLIEHDEHLNPKGDPHMADTKPLPKPRNWRGALTALAVVGSLAVVIWAAVHLGAEIRHLADVIATK